ncbi:unannotated protein [freshwater metagenome]|uniref:Unannotated protein n=1 Tax=freshwater metagenome TaxID=449393 RepID=A0A6J6PL27_9ZZZZ|nr:hypothetical protein [Actinomycetota bacterium]MSW24315.1 hypothetical protein [Actinomycetota bacterium]MSX29590.1 hypothetical protein [Actinomycetota bacterium]MSX42627.1 hypothetical protein [Actinomycetota bacterium]MSX97178.1 hypothetical protein [Actinomycetota bacterium]
MKNSFAKAILGLVVIVSLLASLGSPAQATASPTSLTISGFKTMKSALTSAQKGAIQNFVSANTGIASVSCVGYTGYNYLGVSAHRIKALAKDRARKACNFAAASAGVSVSALSVKITQSQNSSIRKVVLKFTYAVIEPGRYQYSMSNLDPDSVLHGGPVTGYFHEGDLVSSTFSDAYSLDNYTQMGTIDGGGAAYFDHWNTQADDTGTSYRIGDHLGHIPDGTTVTLYAIAATG